VAALTAEIGAVNLITLAIGVGVLAFLFLSRRHLQPLLVAARLPARLAGMIARAAPIVSVAVTVALAQAFDLGAHGVALVGAIPQGLPAFGIPPLSLDLVTTLALPAFLISIVGFVESVSVAQTLAAKRRQRIAPNQELIGLGAANIAAGLSRAIP